MAGKLSTTKAASTTTSKEILLELRRQLGDLAGKGQGAVRNMGAYFTGGQVMRTAGSKVRRERLRKFGVRSRRLKMLTQVVGGRATKIFTTGIFPAVAFGEEISGFSPAELRRLEVKSGAAFPPSSKGRSLEVALLLAGAPTAKRAVSCLCRWAQGSGMRPLGLVQEPCRWRACRPHGQLWHPTSPPGSADADQLERQCSRLTASVGNGRRLGC